jgi:hypothetical protein
MRMREHTVRPGQRGTHTATGFAFVATVIGLLVVLVGLFAPPASAAPISHPPAAAVTVAKPADAVARVQSQVAGRNQVVPRCAYGLAIDNGVRYPTAGSCTITAPPGATAYMGPARPNPPSTLLRLAAEGGAGAGTAVQPYYPPNGGFEGPVTSETLQRPFSQGL